MGNSDPGFHAEVRERVFAKSWQCVSDLDRVKVPGQVFPFTMLNVYPWGISVNVVRPLAVDRTKVSFLSYVWDPSKLDRGAGAALDRVEREDEVVVEAVQKGVRSRLYERGRYSPAREACVNHFHRLLAERLGC